MNFLNNGDSSKKMRLWGALVRRDTVDGIPQIEHIGAVNTSVTEHTMAVLELMNFVVVSYEDYISVLGVTKSIVLGYVQGYIDAHVTAHLAPRRNLILSRQN